MMFLRRDYYFCFLFILGWIAATCHGFLHNIHRTRSSQLFLDSRFQQKRGESDIDFIKRLTAESAATTAAASNGTEQEQQEGKPKKGSYQRIEEWDAERKASGELSWEEKVMFDGQKHGNQVRQNDILNRNLHTY